MQLSIYGAIATAIVDILRYLVGTSGLKTTNGMAYVRSHFFPTPYSVLVGTSGLEPPTSRLSGVCSNQLSYVPV